MFHVVFLKFGTDGASAGISVTARRGRHSCRVNSYDDRSLQLFGESFSRAGDVWEVGRGLVLVPLKNLT